MERYGFTIDNEKLTTFGSVTMHQCLELCFQALVEFYYKGLQLQCEQEKIDVEDKEATKNIRAKMHDDFVNAVSLIADSIYPEEIEENGPSPDEMLKILDEKIAELNKLREANDSNKQE